MSAVLLTFLSLLLTVATAQLNAEHRWNNFKLSHNKVYDSPKEENYRFQVFKDNLRIIGEHNVKYGAGLTTWYMRVNQFSDLTAEEFRSQFLSYQPPTHVPKPEEISEIEEPEHLRIRPSVDYKEAFGPVRNQYNWSTCYAFAATATVEAYLYFKGYPKVVLSPQDIVDCTKGPPYNNNGSYGGWHDVAMQFMKDQGIMQETNYPYTGSENRCGHNPRNTYAKLTNYRYITNTESSLLTTLDSTGPVAINVDAKEWQYYGGGIFIPARDFNTTTHVVVLAGYGQAAASGQWDYWLARNSWGTTWGESGNIRVARFAYGNRHIGIGSPPAFAVIPEF